MTKLFRVTLLAFALGAPMLLTVPAGATAASTQPAPFEEVAQARQGTEARSRQRQRRPTAQTQRRQRQATQRTRRARAAQG